MDNRNTWLKRLANLNVARTERRGLAPHKPLLLLALMDMIEDGNITSRWIAYSAELFFRFSCYWDVVYHRQLNRPDMRLPFHALGGHRDRIWERFTDERQPSRARETTRLCHMDESFWDALQDPAFRRAARIQLVAAYFEPGEQIALCQQLGIPEPTTEAIAAIKQDAAEYKKSLGQGQRLEVPNLGPDRLPVHLRADRLPAQYHEGIPGRGGTHPPTRRERRRRPAERPRADAGCTLDV
jgi:putative restriction endonuclease